MKRALPLLLLPLVAYASSSDVDFSPEMQEQLYALGYLKSYNPAPLESGVTIHEEQRTQPGVNLVLSPHDTGAYIMDMEGNVLHRWSMNVYTDIPRMARPNYVAIQEGATYEYWSRVEPLEGGDILVVYKHIGVFRLDMDSNVKWASWTKAHHDAHIDERGIIYTLAREDRDVFHDAVVRTQSDDYIVALSTTGEEHYRVSIRDAFRRSSFEPHTRDAFENNVYLHTNKITKLDGKWADRHPAFQKGNILVSCRNIDTLAIIEPNAEEVVWMLTGDWVRQHQPVLLKDTMLLFDNRGRKGASQVIEFDPFTMHKTWTYDGSPTRGLQSEVGGSCQRLPNGNTLITESTQGRALEVNTRKEILWEYINPARTQGDQPRLSPLFEVRRLTNYDTTWLNENK